MNCNIYLIGFSGTGKTTTGRLLSKLLAKSFVDMDSEIEKLERLTIPEIFKAKGEIGFREIETALLGSTALILGQIVSTGGGVPALKKNREIMKNNGKVVWLTATPKTILSRLTKQKGLGGSGAARPMLTSDKPLQRIEELLSERINSYEMADLVVNTESREPREVAKTIIEGLNLCVL